MFHVIKLAAALAIVSVLTACASGVTRMDSPSNPSVATAKVQPTVKTVSIRLSEDAKKLHSENLKFNPEELRATVERLLVSQNLQNPDATQVMDIEITSLRVRSAFTAIMFGFMAGNDNVEGIVSVKDASGAVLKKAKVNASYALGGVGGGTDGARLGWLYEEFAKHAAAEVSGGK